MGLFDQPSRQPLPQPNFDDVTHVGRQALVSLVPFLGGPASELLGLLSSPVAQRRDDWLEDLARRLQDLEGHVAGFRFEDLGKNEHFVSAILVATQAAVRTHQEEKRNALRDAVVNVALHTAPDAQRQTAFLSLIDRLEAIHLRVLRTFKNPPITGGYVQWQMTVTLQNPGTPTRWIKEFVPGLATEDQDFIRMLITDLYHAGLSHIGPDAQNIPNDSRWVTAYGRAFLGFISESAE